MAGMIKRVAPLSYEAWLDYDVCGARFSRMELDALRRVVTAGEAGLSARDGAALDEAALTGLGLSPREVQELATKLSGATVPDFELDLSAALPVSHFARHWEREE
jgi:hypothetical protein